MENSKYKGNVTEMQSMLAFMKLGYNVLTPYGDCERYDFVVDYKGKFLKIQCKTSSPIEENVSYRFSCRSTHKINGQMKMEKYEANEIDYFATCIGDKTYLIPLSECGSDKILRFIAPKNGQIRGVNFAKDYELEVTLNRCEG